MRVQLYTIDGVDAEIYRFPWDPACEQLVSSFIIEYVCNLVDLSFVILSF